MTIGPEPITRTLLIDVSRDITESPPVLDI